MNGFSIIICTYNGRSRLERTLQHLASLEVPVGYFVELIIVDNASTDNTASFVKETWLELGEPFTLRIISEQRAGKGYAVETAYDAASYSYILTVDDDNWLSTDYLVKAIELFNEDPEIDVLQGKNEAVFEKDPPEWAQTFNRYFIIGGPIEQSGYFPKNHFIVWGAGMIIKKRDWVFLRSMGFSSLTSKLPGKAAGEDNELAIALLMLGKKIFYSEKLSYKHFMPAERMEWNKLKQNFETFGYANYHLFLYALVIDAHEKGYQLSGSEIKKQFAKYWIRLMLKYSWKKHLAYLVKPQKELYQLRMIERYSQLKWFWRLSKKAILDVQLLQSWMKPVLMQYPGKFEWPWNFFSKTK
jgi:glycosyltransferase involved in cell wall biosynthesis